MLGRQLGIYLDNHDVELVLNEARAAWDCVLLEATCETSAPNELLSASDVPLKSYFCLRGQIETLNFTPAGQGRWTLDTRNNPLIEWWVPPEHAGVLRPGRLFYEPAAIVGDAVFDKDDEFLGFARGLLALVRKLAPKREVDWGTVHVGQSASRRLEDRDLSLVMNG